MWIKVPKLSSLNLKKFMMNCFMLFPYRNIGLSVREGELIEELILSNDQSGDCTIIIVSIFSFNFMIWVFIVMRTLVPLSRKGIWYCVDPYLLRRLMNIMANSIPISLTLISNGKYQKFLWRNQAQKHSMEISIKP